MINMIKVTKMLVWLKNVLKSNLILFVIHYILFCYQTKYVQLLIKEYEPHWMDMDYMVNV